MEKKCGYHGCSKQIKDGKEFKSTLLYRVGSGTAWKDKDYCSKHCAQCDQMAHEG